MKKSTLLAKIVAIFNFKGKKIELDLHSAEVKQEKVFLHPTDDPDHIYCVNAKTVHMLINPEGELTEDDILVVDRKVKETKMEPAVKKQDSVPKINPVPPSTRGGAGDRGTDWQRHNDRLKQREKRRLTITLGIKRSGVQPK